MNLRSSIGVVLAISLLVATSAPSAIAGTVTGMICQDTSCNGQCTAFSSPTDTCRNATVHRCGRNGICLDLRIFSHENCFGDVYENHRVSGECLGDEKYSYGRLTYLSNDIVEIHGNCSDRACKNCNINQRVNVATCFNYYGISGTLENLSICNYVVVDKFADASCSSFDARWAVEEDTCYIIEQSQSYSAHCERGPKTALATQQETKGIAKKKDEEHKKKHHHHKHHAEGKKMKDEEGKNFLRRLGLHA